MGSHLQDVGGVIEPSALALALISCVDRSHAPPAWLVQGRRTLCPWTPFGCSVHGHSATALASSALVALGAGQGAQNFLLPLNENSTGESRQEEKERCHSTSRPRSEACSLVVLQVGLTRALLFACAYPWLGWGATKDCSFADSLCVSSKEVVLRALPLVQSQRGLVRYGDTWSISITQNEGQIESSGVICAVRCLFARYSRGTLRPRSRIYYLV